MKRTRVHQYEILSSVYAWPVYVDLSRNESTGLWTIYIRYADSDHHPSFQSSGLGSGGIACMLEEHFCDLVSFCDSLKSLDVDRLSELAAEITELDDE